MHSIYGVIKESIKFSLYYNSAYNGKLVLEWDTARRKKIPQEYKVLWLESYYILPRKL